MGAELIMAGFVALYELRGGMVEKAVFPVGGIWINSLERWREIRREAFMLKFENSSHSGLRMGEILMSFVPPRLPYQGHRI